MQRKVPDICYRSLNNPQAKLHSPHNILDFPVSFQLLIFGGRELLDT